MLRRSLTTLLVCLVVCLVMVTTGSAWAANPDESLEILLKPEESKAPSTPSVRKARPGYTRSPQRPAPPAYGPPVYQQPAYVPAQPWPTGKRISKVKPPAYRQAAYCPGRPSCILPKPMPRQWEMSAQAIFARVRGRVAWPRYSQYTTYWGDENQLDLNDDLGIPAHDTLLAMTAKYQFRPSWAVRYTGLFDELSGSGYPQRNFWFGNRQWSTGQDINGKLEHGYHRIELVYDAIKTCSTMLSLFGGWAHADNKITVNCSYCGNWQSILSKGNDMGTAGIQLQRCLRTAWSNGGTLSFDHSAAALFLDDVEGWDMYTSLRYSVPLGCNRSGFMKGGYRYIEMKKQERNLILNTAIEGGFVEFGFIF